jgi:maltose alpha-D-glucosyltransferase/alpha-amylase
MHPDLELRRFLSEKKFLKHYAPVAGALEYRSITKAGTQPSLPMTVGILQEYIQDTRIGWDYTLDSLQDYFELVTTQQADITEVPVPSGSLLELLKPFNDATTQTEPDAKTENFSASEIPLVPESLELANQTIGSYLVSAQLLGQSTAELHIALASDPENPDFAPEPFSSFYQRSIYQYARNLTGQTFLLLQDKLNGLPSDTQELARAALDRQQEILGRYQLLLNQKITAMRTRYHGDYHLGRVLYTGKDFIIFDFEGREGRSLSERRMKRSPLRDVAGMMLSFDYAASHGLRSEIERGMIRSGELPLIKAWSRFWSAWVSAAFLNSYLETASKIASCQRQPQNCKCFWMPLFWRKPLLH